MGLITNEVEITLNNRTIRWYENKGYEIPKYYKLKKTSPKKLNQIFTYFYLIFANITNAYISYLDDNTDNFFSNFDLYIESKVNLDFLNEILKTGLNINLYIKDDLNLNHSKAMLVHDINEAISQINYTGNRYSSAIFTSNSLNASKFINEIKSKIITINTSPTIERILDIKQTELMNEKIVIYPLSFNFNNSGVKINLNEIS